MLDIGWLASQASAIGNVAFYPSIDVAVVLMAAIVAFRSSSTVVRRRSTSPLVQCCCTMLCVFAAVQCKSWTEVHYPLSAAALPILALDPSGFYPFQLTNLIGIYRAMNGYASTEILQQLLCASMHACLILTHLNPQSQKILGELKPMFLYKNERRLISIQRKRELTLDDLDQLPERMRLSSVVGEFHYDINEPLFLLRAIIRMIWRPMIPLYILGSIGSVIDVSTSIVDSRILHFIDSPSELSWYEGYVAVLLAFVLNILSYQTQRVQSFAYEETKRVVSALKLELFRLPLTNTGLRKGRTLASARDNTHRIIWGIEGLQSIFATIVGAISSMVPIYGQIGWLVLVPLGMMMAISVIEWLLTKIVGESYLWNSNHYHYRYSGKVSEIYHNIKSVKMFGWERMYVDPELQKHWKKYEYRKPSVWYAPIARAVWFLFDVLSMISRQLSTYLAVYAFTTASSGAGSSISNADMFQLDTLMNNFQYHIETLTWRMRTFRMLIESNYKIEKVLKGDFVESLSHYPIDETGKDMTVESTADGAEPTQVGDEPSILVDECEFAWKKKKPVLKELSFKAKGSELVAVVGKTGSGKSSLLLSICGEVERTKGSGAVFGSIALMEQSPWIMNDTVRENILFGREYDEDHYNRVVEACALVDDIKAWASGDMTVIGERGINISGGQSSRLALARTVYSKADIYVLDDPLSAVDAHVKRHILDKVIMDSGLLGSKLRLVSVNAESLLPYFHQVIRLDDGKASVTQQEPKDYQPVVTKLFTDDENSDSDNDNDDAASDVSSTVAADSLPTSPTVEGSDIKDLKTQETSESNEETATGEVAEPKEVEQSKSEEAADAKEETEAKEDKKKESKPKIREWDKWDNMRYVLKICGLPILATIMFSGLFNPISSFIIDGYKMDTLKKNSSSKGTDNAAVLKYLRIGMLRQITTNLLMRVERFIETTISNTFLDSKIKSMFVENLINVPLSFFDGTTRQEISSAYNKSTDAISLRIPSFLMSSLSTILGATLALYRVGTNAPYLLIIVPLFAWAGNKQSKLFDTALKSLDKIGREAGVEQSRTDDIIADGKRLIRLYDVESHFTKMHMDDSDKSRRTDLPYNMLIDFSWTMYDLLANLSLLLFRISIIAQRQIFGHEISSGEFIAFTSLANMLVRYLRSIVRLPAFALKFSSKVNMFRHYTTIEREKMFVENAIKPPPSWPSSGKIEFRNFSMKYRSDLEYVLKEINVSINPGEKIGIVGRTGAGKSSLSRVLFRLVDSKTCEGSIVIDGHNVFEMNIGDLRPKLGTIPQESTLFSGTFRQNLDPLLEYSIEDMWAALLKCGIVENVQPKRKESKDDDNDDDDDDGYWEGIREEIKEWDGKWTESSWKMRAFLLIFISKPKPKGKKNLIPRRQGLNRFAGHSSGFSNGQQQLFSLCRLLMRKRKVIVLDEATADVDLETDQSMQKLFRSEFKDSTVLTIAHRLETIMGSDRIIVMDKGTIAEFGPPKDLIEKGGLFAELVKANDFEK
ncbi:Multidrug resistance-associated protein 1 [Coemansia sp. RSA 1646]|nr:Multidrug resistance-associated protein 1 [Coemansia sp. RSA 1646]KAJ2092523.1 Multidrug resistance-associated protein 1 [Coemansia sp. RSA 986]